jgi:hypothetical protein
MEFDAGVGGCETPLDLDATLVAILLPCSDGPHHSGLGLDPGG